jgi:hypothetical protein
MPSRILSLYLHGLGPNSGHITLCLQSVVGILLYVTAQRKLPNGAARALCIDTWSNPRLIVFNAVGVLDVALTATMKRSILGVTSENVDTDRALPACQFTAPRISPCSVYVQDDG